VKTFVLLVFAFSLAALVSAHFSASLQGTDFPDFYCAARMLARMDSSSDSDVGSMA